MLAYIVRRLLYVIPITLGVTLLTFVLFNVVAQDPVLSKLGKHATQAEADILRKELGLDRPLPEQYLFYLKQCVTFDFGRSWSTQQKITEMIAGGMGPSLSLAIPAFGASIFFATVIALLLAFVRNIKFDRTVIILCLAGTSISSLSFIIFFQSVLAYKLDMFPISGFDASWVDRWRYLILPMIIWVVIAIGGETLWLRTVMLEEVFQDYVRTARAKGLSENAVMFKHVLKNAMIPIITLTVLEIPFLYTGSLLLERFFGIPGLGDLTVQALNSYDFPVIKAVTFIGTLLYIGFSLLSDILYALVDPRVRLG